MVLDRVVLFREVVRVDHSGVDLRHLDRVALGFGVFNPLEECLGVDDLQEFLTRGQTAFGWPLALFHLFRLF